MRTWKKKGGKGEWETNQELVMKAVETLSDGYEDIAQSQNIITFFSAGRLENDTVESSTTDVLASMAGRFVARRMTALLRSACRGTFKTESLYINT